MGTHCEAANSKLVKNPDYKNCKGTWSKCENKAEFQTWTFDEPGAASKCDNDTANRECHYNEDGTPSEIDSRLVHAGAGITVGAALYYGSFYTVAAMGGIWASPFVGLGILGAGGLTGAYGVAQAVSYGLS